jgi:hypothetical protein
MSPPDPARHDDPAGHDHDPKPGQWIFIPHGDLDDHPRSDEILAWLKVHRASPPPQVPLEAERRAAEPPKVPKKARDPGGFWPHHTSSGMWIGDRSG